MGSIDWGKRCGECKGEANVVPGGGPKQCRLVCIGEAPGASEDFEEVAFTGKAGGEFNYLYLPECARLPRAEVYVTNTVKCRPEQNRKPGKKLIDCCSSHFLKRELETVKPQVVALMGATACSLIPGLKVDLEHGRPFVGKLFGREYVIVPTYHPALGLHKTETIRELMQDFKTLGNVVRKGFSQPPERKFRYIVLGRKNAQFPWPDDGEFELDIDRESVGERLYSVQWSWDGQTGYMARTGDRYWPSILKKLNGLIEAARKIRLHYAQGDMKVLPKNGVNIPWNKVEDTMQMAARLALPQGLKALSFRLHGMRMTDYQDVVRPHSVNALVEWAWKHRKRAVKEKVKKSPGTLGRIVKCALENEKYDPWKKVKEAAEKDPWIKALGDPPEPGLHLVPESEEVEYSCLDPIATGLVHGEMRLRQKRFGRIDEEDYDF